jgi:Anaphase-promoting complex, cyclosome, subunit 3
MQRAITYERYSTAIFFADKILHLITSRQAEDFVKAVYDLANCYLLNKEYLRCIELLEKYAKQQFSLKFKLLAARAYLHSKNVQACLSILDSESQEDDETKLSANMQHL